ncbi:MAG: hypothetical protein U0869_04815 [Chloroflexota bacterium]
MATVNTLLDAIPAKSFTGIADLVRSTRTRSRRTLDLGKPDLEDAVIRSAPASIDRVHQRPVVHDRRPRRHALVSNDGTNAVVHLAAQLSVAVDERREGPREADARGGRPGALDAMVDAMMPQLTAQMSTRSRWTRT